MQTTILEFYADEDTMNAILKIEINALYSIIDELNYYQILKLTPSCIQDEIKPAYQNQGAYFHPDKLDESDEEISLKGKYIFLSIKEAYETLNDASDRLKYDHLLSKGILRIADTKLLNTQDTQGSNDPSQAATNESAKKYWTLGLQAFDAGDFRSAVMQIKFAMQFEPNNEVFQEWLEKAEIESKKAPKQNNNPYKIRL